MLRGTGVMEMPSATTWRGGIDINRFIPTAQCTLGGIHKMLSFLVMIRGYSTKGAI